MICLVFNLILFYVICKYISIQRKNWYVFYSVVSIYVLLTVFLVSLLFEELIFFYVIMPRLLLFPLIIIFITIWSILSSTILIYSYLGWDFIYISNLITNQWYTCLELIYKTMYNLNFNWFAFQMQPEKYKIFRQHYSGNWCIVLWIFFFYIFACGLTQSAETFYKLLVRIFSIFPLKICWFLPWIWFWRNHMLQLEYNTMPTILFYNSSYKDKVFYKLMYSTIDLRVNNEYLSWHFILRHRSLHNLYHLGLLLNSNINSSDFKALVYLPKSWTTGKHFHVSMCQYPTVWKRFLSPLFIKQTSILAKFKKKYGKKLPDTWFAYHDEKELLKQRTIYYNKYHSFFIKAKKGQHYRFCKSQMKIKWKRMKLNVKH